MKPPVSFVLQPSFGDQTTNYSYQQQTPSSASRVQAMAIDQQPVLCSSIAWNSAQQVFNKQMTQLLEKKQATNIEIKSTKNAKDDYDEDGTGYSDEFLFSRANFRTINRV